MTMTESEWQELSDFLARKVMGYNTWDDLTAKYYEDPGPPEPISPWWWIDEGDGSVPIVLMREWRPHNSLTQAMLVLKTLLNTIGRYAAAELHMRVEPSHCRCTIQNWVATEGTPAGFVRSPYVENEMQAICLAAKEWCSVSTQ